MANNTEISWADATWNPLAGCTWASEGCDHCYAAVMARRLDFMAQADIAAGKDPGGKRKYIGITNKNNAGRIMFNGKVNLDPFALDEPRHWTKPRRVFVNSMSDLFHKDVPDEFIGKVWDVMARAHQHTFQVLTKRPERMAELVPQFAARHTARNGSGWPLANIWCGTSVENQEQADKRIPHLLRVPAKVRFLSCEPLLGALDISRLLVATPCWHCGNLDGEAGRCYCGVHIPSEIHWVIVGGESGHGARPMHPNWARNLRDQAQEDGIAFHFKQHGAWMPLFSADEASEYPRAAMHESEDGMRWVNIGKHAAGRLLDGVEWNEFPT